MIEISMVDAVTRRDIRHLGNIRIVRVKFFSNAPENTDYTSYLEFRYVRSRSHGGVYMPLNRIVLENVLQVTRDRAVRHDVHKCVARRAELNQVVLLLNIWFFLTGGSIAKIDSFIRIWKINFW